MKRLKTWFVGTLVLAIYAVVGLFSSAVGPAVVRAQSCPSIPVQCSNGKLKYCSGQMQGNYCYYDRSCMNGGTCGS